MSTQDFVIERRRAGYAIRHYEGNEPIITLPSHFDNNPIEIVGDYAFSRNAVINQVTIPAGVEYIGFYAFGMCENLESIVIPNTIQHIEANAFYGYNSLKQIVFKGTRNQWNQIVSYGDYLKERCQDIIIFAPESELSDFLNNISANLDRELKNK